MDITNFCGLLKHLNFKTFKKIQDSEFRNWLLDSVSKMFCVWIGFHLACEYGHYDTVKVFLKYSSDSIYSNKINLNAPDEFGYTGFHVACREGFPKIVELIMRSSEALNINLNAKSNSVGYTGKVIDTKYSIHDFAYILAQEQRFVCSN